MLLAPLSNLEFPSYRAPGFATVHLVINPALVLKAPAIIRSLAARRRRDCLRPFRPSATSRRPDALCWLLQLL
jgi:hypothetical protein